MTLEHQIAAKIQRLCPIFSCAQRDNDECDTAFCQYLSDLTNQIVTLLRQIGEPPVLSDGEINVARAKTIGEPLVCRQQHRDIAKAQRGADIKWWKEKYGL